MIMSSHPRQHIYIRSKMDGSDDVYVYQHNFVAKAQLDYSNTVCINPNLDRACYFNRM